MIDIEVSVVHRSTLPVCYNFPENETFVHRLEEFPIPLFALTKLLFCQFTLGDVAENEHHARGVAASSLMGAPLSSMGTSVRPF